MTMAYTVAMKSKDPSTKVGAIIVGSDMEIRSSGYNGLPRDIEDKLERYEDKEFKYIASNHAEENAILHCARVGISSIGCTIYTPWFPCALCSKAIIQSGIIAVVFDKRFPGNNKEKQENWQKSISISEMLLSEAKVQVREFNDSLISIEGLYKGKSFSLY